MVQAAQMAMETMQARAAVTNHAVMVKVAILRPTTLPPRSRITVKLVAVAKVLAKTVKHWPLKQLILT